MLVQGKIHCFDILENDQTLAEIASYVLYTCDLAWACVLKI